MTVVGTLNAAVVAGSITNAANVGITNDPSNGATMYPTFVSATSGNQAIRIDSTGLVWIPSTNRLGIGITTPTTSLDVRGNILLKGDATDGGVLSITRRYSTGPQTINFNNNHPSTNLDWTGARITSADSGNYNGYLDFAVSLGSNANETAGTAAVTSVMRLTSGGNVGIGITNPTQKLEVYTGAGYVTASTNDGVGSNGGFGYQLRIANTNHVIAQLAGVYTNSGSNGSGGIYISTRSAGTLTERLRINDIGNVGIGTASPTAKLEINPSDGGDTRSIQTFFNTSAVYNPAAAGTANRVASGLRFNWYSENWQIGAGRGGGTDIAELSFSRNGTAHIIVNSSGFLGIGKTVPTSRLHIFQDGLANNTVNPLITLDGKFNVVTVDSNDIVAIASRIENNAGGSQTTNIIGSGFQTTYNSLLLQPSGGNVGVNNINPGRALDVTGVTNVSSHITQGPLISRPNVSWGASGSATGAVVIKFPGGTSNYGMIHAVIDIYTYDGENASTIIIGGHNWNSAWYNFGATRIGAFSKGVRLGFKDGQYCIVLGTNTSTWSYGQVVVRKIQNGSYYSGIMDLGGTYSIALDAAAESYTYISSNLITTGSAGGGGWNSGNDGSGSGLDADLIDGLDSTAFLRRDVTNTMFAGETSQLRFENLTTFFRFAFNDLRFYDLNNGADIFGLDEHAYATTSMRAPIFYDRNDTAYYLDPASTSLLNTLQLNGNITRLGGYSPTNGAIRMTPNLHLNALASYSVIVNWDNGTTGATRTFRIGNGASTEVYYIRADGYSYQTNYAENASSFRAPIFYDSANTAYYTDPASISSMYGVAIRGDTSSVDSANQIFFWDAGDTTTSAIGFKANGGEFTNPTGNGDGYNTYLTMDTVGRGWVFRRGTGGTNFNSAFTSGWILNNGIWQANDSMRAPIFYDSNNTAFYIDPASSSIVNNLTVSGTLTYSGTLSVEGAEVLTVDLNTSAGNQGWDLHGNRAMQAIYGNHSPLNNGNVYNTALFRGGSWTMYGFNGSSWVNLGTVPNLTNGYGKAAFGGVTLSRSYSQFIIDCGATFGYTFMSALTLTHSTSGNSMDVYFEKSTSATYNSGTWTTMASATGVGSWPGGTSIKFSDYVGGAAPPYVRLRIIPSWNAAYPSNTISLGQLFVSAAYGGGNQLLEWDSSYNVTANGSFRAPIFYDSNDTNYYVDANSNSRLVNLGLGGVTPDIRLSVSGDGHFSGVIHLGGTAGSYNSWGSRDYTTSSLRYFNAQRYQFNNFGYGSTYTIDIDTSGNLIASNSVRAPIFYDSNNTAYYTDQAGTSNYFNLQITGASNKYLYLNPGNGYEAMVRYNGGSGSGWYVGKRVASQVVGTESFHFYSEAAGQTVGGIDTNGNIFARDSVRAPIFYDSADTSYYLNANGSSNLRNVAATGTGVVAHAFYKTSNGTDTGTNVLFQNNFGNHSYGMVAEFRVNGVSDRPSISFSSDQTTTTWAVGFGQADDNFRVVQNLGYRGSSGWGTPRLLVDTAGNFFSYVSTRSPIFYDSNDTGYYVDPNGTTVLSTLYHNAGTAYFRGGTGVDQCCGDNGAISVGGNSTKPPRIAWHSGGIMEGTMEGSGTGWRKIYFYDQQGAGLGVHATGQIASNVEVVAYYSDRRLKEDLERVTDHWNVINNITGYRYTWNEKSGEIPGFIEKVGKREVGLIAQDVLAVYPEAVYTRQEGPTDDPYKTIMHDRFSAVFIEALKDLKKEVDQLKQENKELRDMLNARPASN
jgi:hypothetical protein